MSAKRVVSYSGMLALCATTAWAAGETVPSKERAVTGPVITAVAKQRTALPGEVVEVEVFISNVSDMGAYQVSLATQGGESGALKLENLEIQNKRADYAFAGGEVVKAVHLEGLRMGAIQVHASADVGRRAYLGTYRFRASEDAAGAFTVGIKVGKESFLRNSLGTAIEFRAGKPATVTVGEVTTDRVGAEKK